MNVEVTDGTIRWSGADGPGTVVLDGLDLGPVVRVRFTPEPAGTFEDALEALREAGGDVFDTVDDPRTLLGRDDRDGCRPGSRGEARP